MSAILKLDDSLAFHDEAEGLGVETSVWVETNDPDTTDSYGAFVRLSRLEEEQLYSFLQARRIGRVIGDPGF